MQTLIWKQIATWWLIIEEWCFVINTLRSCTNALYCPGNTSSFLFLCFVKITHLNCQTLSYSAEQKVRIPTTLNTSTCWIVFLHHHTSYHFLCVLFLISFQQRGPQDGFHRTPRSRSHVNHVCHCDSPNHTGSRLPTSPQCSWDSNRILKLICCLIRGKKMPFALWNAIHINNYYSVLRSPLVLSFTMTI